MEQVILGIGTGEVSYVEYYSYNVMKDFENYSLALQNAYLNARTAILAGQQPSAADYNTIVYSLQNMKNLAQEGRTDTNGKDNYQSFMTADMVKTLTNVTSSLAAVGITASSSLFLTDNEKSQALSQWYNYGQNTTGVNIDRDLQKAVDFVADIKNYVIQIKESGTGVVKNLLVEGFPARTLQSMLGLEYVGTGNTMMSYHMDDLETALDLSIKTLDSLKTLQNIANQITVSPKTPPFIFPTDAQRAEIEDANDKGKKFEEVYKAAANAYFTQLYPDPTPLANSAELLFTTKVELQKQLDAIQKAIPVNPKDPRDKDVPAGLADALKKVLNDLNKAFAGVDTNDPNALLDATKKWILDNQDKTIDDQGNQQGAGDIAANLQSAIVNAESLKERQRENVREYLYVFQEFYKSAGGMIDVIGTIISKITKGFTQK